MLFLEIYIFCHEEKRKIHIKISYESILTLHQWISQKTLQGVVFDLLAVKKNIR